MKILKKGLVVLFILCMFLSISTKAEARSLTKSQKQKAETIYEECSKEKNWKKYGVLPTVCIAQAFVESGIGQKCRPNNLWGLRCGRASYSSLKSGIKAYMQCINNGYYKGAPHKKNYRVQLDKILDGGYCQPRGAYFSHAMQLIRDYDLDKYDKKMFKKFKQIKKKRKEAKKRRQEERRRKKQEKERLERLKNPFTLIFDSELSPWELDVNKDLIGSGTVLVDLFFLEVVHKNKDLDKDTVVTGNPLWRNRPAIMFREVFENAVG